VAPLYNHPISAKILYGYYFKARKAQLTGYFFRFTSKFIHDGDEEMIFDINETNKIKLVKTHLFLFQP
uniref:hypothetical protein n=1 Tax=uncultured Maritalea sp. TaxID=757249 RepID=UPI002629BDE0